MAIDFTHPLPADLYDSATQPDVLEYIRDNITAVSTMLENLDPPGKIVGTKRLKDGLFDRWSGSAWAPYPINYLPLSSGVLTGDLVIRKDTEPTLELNNPTNPSNPTGLQRGVFKLMASGDINVAGYDAGIAKRGLRIGSDNLLYDIATGRKLAVESASGSFLPIAGGTVTGPTAFNAQVIVSLGTNLAPGICFSNDPDTGIYSPGNGHFAVTSNGVQALVCESNANVRIPLGLALADATTGQGGATPLYIVKTWGANSFRYGLLSQVTVDSSETQTAARTQYARNNVITSSLTAAAAGGFANTLRGGADSVSVGAVAGANTGVTTATAGYHIVTHQAGSGTDLTAIYGSHNHILCTNVVGADMLIGTYSHTQTSSTFTGTIDAMYGTYNRLDRDAGTVTNAYGVYNSFEGTIGYKWGVYSNGDSANYLTGALSLGEPNSSIFGPYKFFVNGSVAVSGAAGTTRSLNFTTAGSLRWGLATDSTVESSVSSGTNLIFARYNNSGAYIDAPLIIYRDTGAVTCYSQFIVQGANANHKILVYDWGQGRGYGIILKPFAAGTQYPILFQNAAGGQSGFIVTTDTTVGFGQGSDYRLKINSKRFKGGAEMLQRIPFYEGEHVEDRARTHHHYVIAHELQEVLPYAVFGDKDGEKMQLVDYAKLIPILGAALQEALERIERLESKVPPTIH
jgi:hypothetical protein